MNSIVQLNVNPSKIQYKLLFNKFLTIVAVASGLGILLSIGFSEFNPDWMAYDSIYETSGGWISEQGRDPFFVWLLSIFNRLIGSDGYETFRLIVSLYFLAFGTVLASGLIIPIFHTRWMKVQLPVAIFSLAFTRFTVQIREGIAVTLVLIGLAVLLRADKADSLIKRRMFIYICLVILTLGALTHLGSIVVLIGLLMVLLSRSFGKFGSRQMMVLWALTALIGVIFVALIIKGWIFELPSVSDFGLAERIFFEEETSLSLLKVLLWMGYGIVLFLITKTLNNLISFGDIKGLLGATLLVISGPIATVSLASIYTLIIMKAPVFFIGQFVRLLNLLLSISLLFIAARSKKASIIILCSIFLMVYQIRSVIEAILMYFGIDVLQNFIYGLRFWDLW